MVHSSHKFNWNHPLRKSEQTGSQHTESEAEYVWSSKEIISFEFNDRDGFFGIWTLLWYSISASHSIYFTNNAADDRSALQISACCMLVFMRLNLVRDDHILDDNTSHERNIHNEYVRLNGTSASVLCLVNIWQHKYLNTHFHIQAKFRFVEIFQWGLSMFSTRSSLWPYYTWTNGHAWWK